MLDTRFDPTCRFQPVTIRALRSMTDRQASAIEAGLPAGWFPDRHESYDGHLSLLVTSRMDDQAGFTVDGGGTDLHLGRLRGDVHEHLGTFAEAGALLDALVRAAGSAAPGRA